MYPAPAEERGEVFCAEDQLREESLSLSSMSAEEFRVMYNTCPTPRKPSLPFNMYKKISCCQFTYHLLEYVYLQY